MTRLASQALLTAALALSQNAWGSAPESSAAFCLFELPSPADKRVWLNLGIVQYIEQHPDELVVYYGGGRFGSGYEARIPVRSQEEAAEFLDRMRSAAARCVGK